jgi:hypothetical protein
VVSPNILPVGDEVEQIFPAWAHMDSIPPPKSLQHHHFRQTGAKKVSRGIYFPEAPDLNGLRMDISERRQVKLGEMGSF